MGQGFGDGVGNPGGRAASPSAPEEDVPRPPTRRRPRTPRVAGARTSPPHHSPPKRRAAHSGAPGGPSVAPGPHPPSCQRRRRARPRLGPALREGRPRRSGPGVLGRPEPLLPRRPPLGPRRHQAPPPAAAAGWGARPAERGSGAGPRPGPPDPHVTRDDQARRRGCSGTPAPGTWAPAASAPSAASAASSCSAERDAVMSPPPSPPTARQRGHRPGGGWAWHRLPSPQPRPVVPARSPRTDRWAATIPRRFLYPS